MTWYELISQQPLSAVEMDERVMAYGDGFFTTMAVINGTIAWLDYHLQRIAYSASALGLTLANDREAIGEQLTCFAQQLQHGILKLVVCRRSQPVRGYGFIDGRAHQWVKLIPMTLTPPDPQLGVPVQPAIHATCLTQQIACLPAPIAGLKLLNAQDKVMASAALLATQQRHTMIGEGLVQDVLGNWVEGTISNVFYQLKDELIWFTPPITHAGVKGVMRQVLLDKLPQLGERVVERALGEADLDDLTALFFCNAVRGVMPVTQLYLPSGQVVSCQLPKMFDKRP